MTPDSFQDGLRAGKTEASLEGLARSIDELRTNMATLTHPKDGMCAEHKKEIGELKSENATLKNEQTLIRRLMMLVVAAVIGIGGWIAHRGN